MWEQYKKTFLSTQIFILAIAALLFFKLHNMVQVMAFITTMEGGAFIGAAWATRLKRILRSRG